jgi:methyltransferase (TIGR00027 family)
MRADRPSLTATLVAGVRALYAAFPEELRVAPDPHADALVPAVLALPGRAVARAPWLSPVVHHALGAATLGLSWHVALRTLAIDDAARAAIRAGARQIVLLGAGLDNRAGRLEEAACARVFEVDHPDMQRYKRARLEGAGVNDDRVLVPVNFERDRLGESLERAGFSRELPAFWIWEGVTAYLTHGAIEGTLGAIADLSAKGSWLAITYMRPADEIGHAIDRMASFAARIVGEPVHARYRRHEMADLLRGFGFEVRSDDADADLADRYWKDPPSAHPRTIHLFPEWERLAVAERV